MAGTPSQDVEMDHRAPLRRPRSRTSLLIAALALVLCAGVLTSCETTDADRHAVINGVNAARAAAGMHPVVENATLDMKADAWAQVLRGECGLRHSRLADGAPREWRKLGENVGMGGTIDQIQVAYMNSPGHRANILDRSFTQMGAAAVWGNCGGVRKVFTVQVFMKA